MKKRVIFLERKQFKELREFFGLDKKTVYSALHFKCNSERAKRIRTYAMNNLKGKYYEYEETNGNNSLYISGGLDQATNEEIDLFWEIDSAAAKGRKALW